MQHKSEASGKIFTEEILPRDFGVVEYVTGAPFFRTPAAEARALFLLASPEEKRKIIEMTALEAGVPPADLEELIAQGITRKHGKQSKILELGGRDVLEKVTTRNGIFAAGMVRSQSGDESHEVSITLKETPFGLRIHSTHALTKADFHEGSKDAAAKNYLSTLIAVLANALYLDGDKPTWQTITSLEPKNRIAVPRNPFYLNLERAPVVIGRSIAEYYALGSNQYTTSVAHFQDSGISRRLMADIHAGRASFAVIKQQETRQAPENITENDIRLLASIRETKAELETWIGACGYRSVSGRRYVREFVGTPFETVAQRFENGRGALHLVAGARRKRPDGEIDYMPPVVVAHLLSSPSNNSSSLPRDFFPFGKDARNGYDGVDDATRHQARSIVLVPGFKSDKIRLALPDATSQLLQRAYQKWMI